MTRLSVNINKIATLRNSRGGNIPNLIKVAQDIQSFGAQGITIHPRPDERHIRYQDAIELKEVINTEYNIEGNPIQKFIDLVLKVKPSQVTLVPDKEDSITSNSGWDTIKNKSFLREVIDEFKRSGIRTSIFVDPLPKMIQGASEVEADRIELYTESYAKTFKTAPKEAVSQYLESSKTSISLGLGINAGHDLNLENILFFKQSIPKLLEVSIGHALISEALYLGLDNVINMYLNKLK